MMLEAKKSSPTTWTWLSKTSPVTQGLSPAGKAVNSQKFRQRWLDIGRPKTGAPMCVRVAWLQENNRNREMEKGMVAGNQGLPNNGGATGSSPAERTTHTAALQVAEKGHERGRDSGRRRISVACFFWPAVIKVRRDLSLPTASPPTCYSFFFFRLLLVCYLPVLLFGWLPLTDEHKDGRWRLIAALVLDVQGGWRPQVVC